METNVVSIFYVKMVFDVAVLKVSRNPNNCVNIMILFIYLNFYKLSGMQSLVLKHYCMIYLFVSASGLSLSFFSSLSCRNNLEAMTNCRYLRTKLNIIGILEKTLSL